ncbi:MAG: TRAP transporter large permease subunit [Gammaproteobacteria bacterium]|nr:TRAP transporter large permease subunit [Gammaproteobacteria bacterium]
MEFNEIICILMFASFIGLLFSGYPIAWILGGVAIIFTFIGDMVLTHTSLMANSFYTVDWVFSSSVVNRIWDTMNNWVLVALPMFIFMGHMLDRSGLASDLMYNMSRLFGRVRGGLAITIAIIGLLLAASTGIIGASIVLLSLLGLPAMMEKGYKTELATGTICSIGTLGILIPPSIMLVLMADRQGISVGDLFMGALIPGVMLGFLYIGFILAWGFFRPEDAPAGNEGEALTLGDVSRTVLAVIPPALLIFVVLGSIFFGIATPTEAAGVGAFGTIILAIVNRKFTLNVVRDVCRETTKTTSFIFAIFIGATAFSLVLRGFGGDELIGDTLKGLPYGPNGIVITILVFTFLLGFFLDWIEITLIILPLVSPVIQSLGFDTVWFTVLFAMCLQTSFLTPPVGFALFYLKGVAPASVTVGQIYRGVIPFIFLQITGLILIFVWPKIVTWLPGMAYVK